MHIPGHTGALSLTLTLTLTLTRTLTRTRTLTLTLILTWTRRRGGVPAGVTSQASAPPGRPESGRLRRSASPLLV